MATKCGLEREADGTAKGVKYFDADPSHGSFLRGKNKNVTVGDFPERDLMDSDVDHDEDVGDDDKEIEKAGGGHATQELHFLENLDDVCVSLVYLVIVMHVTLHVCMVFYISNITH